MASINIQAVMDAIKLALQSIYPNLVFADDGAARDIEQGVFAVHLVSGHQERINLTRYRRVLSFEVVYDSNHNDHNCAAAADNLSLALDTVATLGGDRLHGSGMTWHIEEGVLHFMVSYGYTILRQTERYNMETLQIKEGGLYGD